jgi:hypothetical protein
MLEIDAQMLEIDAQMLENKMGQFGREFALF